jgi:hypothetical protein
MRCCVGELTGSREPRIVTSSATAAGFATPGSAEGGGATAASGFAGSGGVNATARRMREADRLSRPPRGLEAIVPDGIERRARERLVTLDHAHAARGAVGLDDDLDDDGRRRGLTRGVRRLVVRERARRHERRLCAGVRAWWRTGGGLCVRGARAGEREDERQRDREEDAERYFTPPFLRTSETRSLLRQ